MNIEKNQKQNKRICEGRMNGSNKSERRDENERNLSIIVHKLWWKHGTFIR